MNYFNCLFGLLVGMFFSINALGAFNSGAYSLYLFTRNGVIQAHLPHTLKPQSSVERKMLQTDVEVSYQDVYERQFSHILKALADVDISRLKQSQDKNSFIFLIVQNRTDMYFITFSTLEYLNYFRRCEMIEAIVLGFSLNPSDVFSKVIKNPPYLSLDVHLQDLSENITSDIISYVQESRMVQSLVGDFKSFMPLSLFESLNDPFLFQNLPRQIKMFLEYLSKNKYFNECKDIQQLQLRYIEIAE